MKIFMEYIKYDTPIFRTPFKFGSATIKDLVVPEITLRLTDNHREGIGIGAMTLGNAWSFPAIPYDQSLKIMRILVERITSKIHLLDINGSVLEASQSVLNLTFTESDLISKELNISIPKLCSLVCFSPFDIALFDAWGKLYQKNTYQLLREENDKFKKAVLPKPLNSISIFHTVGGLDVLTSDEITNPVNDGLPEDLESWIRKDQLTHFKIKMRGDNPDWDFQRILGVDKVCSKTVHGEPTYSLDCNEKCPSGEILFELLNRLQKESPKTFQRIQFVEQPTSREFRNRPEDNVTQAAKLKPIAIDEGLTDFDAYQRAGELGYNGIVLKACKGIGFSLEMAAIAREENLFLTVQDLTCPGISFLASASLAAWTGVDGIEANARQFCPQANKIIAQKRPEVFVIQSGKINTHHFTTQGLGY